MKIISSLFQVIISHNEEFVTALCTYISNLLSFAFLSCAIGSEIWNVEAGRVAHRGKTSVVEDAFADNKFGKGSGSNTPVRSRVQTPAASVNATPSGSGAEDNKGSPGPGGRKKKVTRNQMKAQEERRRIRKLNWLTFGGPKPEDTDED